MKTAMCGIALMLAAGAASATNVHFHNVSPGYYGDANGGEFTAVFDAPSGVIAGTASDTTGVADSFQTFCLELNEHIRRNGNYFGNIAAAADAGGVAGPSPDPLNDRTKVLYLAFRYGDLDLYNYTDLSADGDRELSADALQLAIWSEEEGVDLSTTNRGDAASRSLAMDMIAWADAHGNDYTSAQLGHVKVMNLWSYDSVTGERILNQSMLALVPLPSAAALAGLGLGGVAVRRRRAL